VSRISERLSRPQLRAMELEAKRFAVERLKPLCRPDMEEDLVEVPVVFKSDRRVTRCVGVQFDGATPGHLGTIVVYTHFKSDDADLRNTILHELAHAVVFFMRPDEFLSHANGLWGHVMALFGYPISQEECEAFDVSSGFRKVKKKT
jgi:hypothetical protein